MGTIRNVVIYFIDIFLGADIASRIIMMIEH